VDPLGENFEVELLTKRPVSEMAVLAFFQELGICCAFEECSEVISSWKYEMVRKIKAQGETIVQEVSAGNIVRKEGYTPDHKKAGVMFYRKEDNTYSTSIWFEHSIKPGLGAVIGDGPTTCERLSADQMNVFSPFEIVFVIAGIEMYVDYRDTLSETIQHSAGVLQWGRTQEDGTFAFME